MLDFVNPAYTSPEAQDRLSKDFQNAFPYKHLVMDNFLIPSIADSLHNNFPTLDKLNKHYKGFNEQKSEGSNFEDFHPEFEQTRKLIMSPEFAQWTAKVTGIPLVFVTDDKLGTGLHQGGSGSFLDIHIDFNIHASLDVYRRLNMLIYFNQNWQPEYGGDLEMWDAKMTKCEKKVSPIFNRAVIFETNEISYHGYSKTTLPDGVTRKSFYTYFYTEAHNGNAKYHDTVFKAKPEDSLAKRVGTSFKETLKNFAKSQLKRFGFLK